MVFDVRIGTVFNGKWKVIDVIGGGSQGEIYGVEDVNTEQKYAMKLSGKSEALNEIQALALLEDSDYFPKVVDRFVIDEMENKLAFVMSLGGMNLYDLRLNNESDEFESRTTLVLAHHIVKALEFCHRRNIVHRDIRENNIVVKSNPSQDPQPIMLIDLGLSISIENQKELKDNDIDFTMSKCCSPRMHAGLVATPRCDLTMLLYMLLAERDICPFGGGAGMTDISTRIQFESNPAKYIPAEEKWLLEMAKCVFAVPHGSPPNYARIQEIISTAENGFQPHMASIELSTNDGETCLN